MENPNYRRIKLLNLDKELIEFLSSNIIYDFDKKTMTTSFNKLSMIEEDINSVDAIEWEEIKISNTEKIQNTLDKLIEILNQDKYFDIKPYKLNMCNYPIVIKWLNENKQLFENYFIDSSTLKTHYIYGTESISLNICLNISISAIKKEFEKLDNALEYESKRGERVLERWKNGTN